MSNRDINDPTNKAAEAGRNAADETVLHGSAGLLVLRSEVA